MQYLRYCEKPQDSPLDFPLEYHYLTEVDLFYQMPYHWHDEYEILYVSRGIFELCIGSEMLTLKPGDVAFLSADSLHGGAPKDGCIYESIVFDMEQLLKCNEHCRMQVGDILQRRLALQALFRCDDRVIRHTIPPLFEALRTKCAGWELITLGCLFQFLGECFKYCAYSSINLQAAHEDKRVQQLKTVFELMEKECGQLITLEKLSASVGMTPKYFCRFFKNAIRYTPIDYLGFYRVEKASYLFATTAKSVKQVSGEVGFTNTSYFIRLFKSMKGMTPGQFAAKYRRK